MRVILTLSAFTLGVGVTLAVFYFGGIYVAPHAPTTTRGLGVDISTYLSLLSVILTATTVVLATLAIGISVVAIFTFRELKLEARRAAILAIDKELSEEAINNRVLKVAAILRPNPTVRELEEGFDNVPGEER